MNIKKTKEHTHKKHLSDSAIDFERLYKNKKLPLAILDERWLLLFPEDKMTARMKELREELNHLLMKQGKAVDDIKGYKRYKNQLLQEIMANMDIDNSPLGKLKSKKLEKNTKLIQDINDELAKNEDELADIPYTIKEKNEELMGETTRVCYNRLNRAGQELKEVREEIEQRMKELAKLREEEKELQKNNRDMYLYLHDMLGNESMKILDEYLEWSEEEL